MTTAAIDSLLARLGTVGGRIVLVENRLKVRAPAPLPNDLVAGLRAAKVEIMARLKETRAVWAPEDWRAFFDERAAIAEHNAGLSRAAAEAQAYESCVVTWLNQNPMPASGPDRCSHCGEPMVETDALPFLNGAGGHVWMHGRCHGAWMARRWQEAVQALAAMGVTPTAAGPSRGPDLPENV